MLTFFANKLLNQLMSLLFAELANYSFCFQCIISRLLCNESRKYSYKPVYFSYHSLLFTVTVSCAQSNRFCSNTVADPRFFISRAVKALFF